MSLLALRSPTCACCVQEEDEVPDDETVNQMIARSEEEFEQFMVSVWMTTRSSHRHDSSPADLPVFRCPFAVLPPLSAWTWTAVARRPVTLGENLA